MLVAPRVRVLLAPNPSLMTGPGTNTYLIGEHEVAVVDPGPDLPAHVEAILAAVAETGGRIVASLATHAHPDHLPAAFRLRERTGAPILAHADVPGIDRALDDGAEVALGAERVTAYATPGHAREHLCFWLAADRLLFAGDLVAGVGTVVLDEQPGSLTRYLASLQRMQALGPSTLLPGHGPAVADGQAKLAEYSRHRAERDQQILSALDHGPASVETLVTQIYADTPAALHPLAARNVRAHLERLAEVGQVVRTGGRWALLP